MHKGFYPILGFSALKSSHLFCFENKWLQLKMSSEGLSFNCCISLDAYLFWQENALWTWAHQHINSPLMLLKISPAANSLQKTPLCLEQQFLYICRAGNSNIMNIKFQETFMYSEILWHFVFVQVLLWQPHWVCPCWYNNILMKHDYLWYMYSIYIVIFV